MDSATPILNENYLRELIVGTYLVSYLLQLLGPRRGSFAILLGASVLTLAPLPAHILGSASADFPAVGAVAVVGLSLFLAALAFLIRARPRAGGWGLVAVFVAGALVLLIMGRESMSLPGVLKALFQMGLVFGCTGLGLLITRQGHTDPV